MILILEYFSTSHSATLSSVTSPAVMSGEVVSEQVQFSMSHEGTYRGEYWPGI